MAVVYINGKKCNLKSRDDLILAVSQFLRKHNLSPDDHIKIADLKEDSSLHNQLQLYSKVTFDNYSVSQALTDLGFYSTGRMSIEQIKEQIGKVFTKKFFTDLYEGKPRNINFKQLLLKHSRETRQAYYACFNPTRKDVRDKILSLESIVNSLGDSFVPSGGKKPYDMLARGTLSYNVMKSTLRSAFYRGENISPMSLPLMEHGSRLDYGMRNLASSSRELFDDINRHEGEKDLFDKIKTRKTTPSKRKKHKMAKAIAEILGIEDLSYKDLIVDGDNARKRMSLIAERELLFMLSIVSRYDRSTNYMGDEFSKVFGKNFVEAIHSQHRLAIGYEFADGRLITGEDDILFEVKTYQSLRRDLLTNTLKKYSGITHWSDGSRITKKVFILNTPDKSVDEIAARLSSDELTIISGKKFSGFYAKSLELLTEADHEYLFEAPIPMHDINGLLYIHSLVSEKQSMLQTRGLRMLRDWAAEMLRQNMDGFDNRVLGRKRHYYEDFQPFEAFNHFYGGKENIMIKGALILDIETAGEASLTQDVKPMTSRHIHPTTLLTMGYCVHDHMVAHTLFARNPAEEQRLLIDYYNIRSQYDRIYTFYGKPFDVPYIEKRSLVHRILSEKDYEHIDKYRDWRKQAVTRLHQKFGLKSFERTLLGKTRKDDVPGNEIPGVYLDYIYGLDDHHVENMILHNQLDVITLAILASQDGIK